LLNALCEETIEPKQLRRLEELVLSHPEAEAYYVQFMSLQADLIGHFRALPASLGGHGGAAEAASASVKATGPANAGAPSSRRRRALGSLLLLTGLAAAMLLTFMALRHNSPLPPPPDNADGERMDESVAVLLQAPGADWGDTDPLPRVGSPLPPSRLHLKSGLAQLEFYSGATVILEGPAEIELLSTSDAHCTQGKLRVMVPRQARGYTITTPKFDLVDRGTEFGLSVNPQRTEVHVFKGVVDLYNAGGERGNKPEKELTTGRGLRLEEPGAAQAIASDSTAFLTAQDLAARREAELRQRQNDWLKSSEQCKRDPSLLVYYTFQPEEPWSRTLVNQAAGQQGTRDGVIIGGLWGAGRWPGRKGLEFKQVSDRVRLRVPGAFDALTLAAWVRVDSLPNQNNSLFMTDGWRSGAPHWQIGLDGKLILGVRDPNNLHNAHYHAPGVLIPHRWGQWVHLALVYDRSARLVTHFVDGHAIVQEPMLLDTPLRLGNAEIGNWTVTSHRTRQPIRNFNGCIDEFMLFSRSLSAPEIEQLYEKSRPPS
jgi:ferric-dicitrate binding protein FerR (iron transport regulator)